MSSNKKILKSAGFISLATMASRVLGMIRDIGSAWIFGTGMVWDAFIGAFMLPNLVRRIFGEGALNAALVPVLSESLEEKNEPSTRELISVVISSVVVILTVLVMVMFVVIYIFLEYFHLDEKTRLLFELSYVLFPYVIFICLAAVFMGILNTFRHFTVPALFPIVLNVFWIMALGCLWFVSDWSLEKKIWIVCWGILGAGVVQMAMQIPMLRRFKVSFKFRINRHHPGIRKIARLFIPVVIGTAIVPINVFITRVIAHFLGVGIQSSLYFSERLIQLPLGIVATPMGQVILPELSRQATRKDFDKLRETFSFSMRQVLLLTIPMMAGLIVLRRPIVRVLFEHGAFGQHSTFLTSQALMYYAFGLVAYASIRILTPVFYAMQDTKRPMIFSCAGMLMNIVFSLILMRHMRGAGLALAMSLSSSFQAFFLLAALKKKLNNLDDKKILTVFVKILAISCVMAVCCSGFMELFSREGAGILYQVVILLGAIGAGMAVFAALCSLFKVSELKNLFEALVAKRAKRA
ncbi:murein biosynthesis integral membrane protein MurJ [PVC group bacterium]|nr:murein biosynthesis integral membrane protein MurJ [PVC group bacterium]